MVDKFDIRRFEYIDSLRGIAILLVVAVHAGQIVFHPGVYASVVSLGAYGVQLFFIVSALTLFLSYEQRQLIDKASTNKYFFIRRFARIAPAFYLAICLYTLSFFVKNYILLGSPGTISWANLLVFASFLSVFCPPSMFYLPFGGWTIEIEMFFYLFIPFLFKIISNIRRAVLFFVLSWFGYAALNYSLFSHGPWYEYSSYMLFPSQLPVFAIGILVFHIIRKFTLKVTRPYLSLILLLAYLVLALFLSSRMVFLSESVLVSIFCGGLVLLMSAYPIRLLQNRVTEFFGKVSYSLYLWHFIIILFFWYTFKATYRFYNTPSLLSFFVIYFVTLALGAVVSWLSFKYVEKNGINLGKKLILKLSKPENVYEKS